MEEVIQDKIKLSANEVEEILANNTAFPKTENSPAKFNHNKLQSVVCMLASALASIALLAWMIL